MAQVSYNYAQATYMSNFFYNAQRVGHLPADNSVPWRYNSLLYEQGAWCWLPSVGPRLPPASACQLLPTAMHTP